jgi:hypothetical protein
MQVEPRMIVEPRADVLVFVVGAGLPDPGQQRGFGQRRPARWQPCQSQYLAGDSVLGVGGPHANPSTTATYSTTWTISVIHR